MSLQNLAKGISIRQRYDLLRTYYLSHGLTYEDDQLTNYTKWRQRPTLVTDERFEEILTNLSLTEEAFDFAIKDLSEQEKAYLFKHIQKEPWVQLTQAVFVEDDKRNMDVFELTKANFTYALRLHIDFFEGAIDDIILRYPTLQIKTSAVADYVSEIINRLMDIGLKTFVYDLHAKKEHIRIAESLNEQEAFQHYLMARFDTKEKLQVFFSEYPVLTRLYAETIIFQIQNFTELLQALEESQKELHSQFQLSLPICLTGLKMGAGDSHDQGKSVGILTFNQSKELVYKPKDLLIGQRFDQFIQKVKEIEPKFDFYLTNKLVKTRYTFEERLVYSECQTLEDLTDYYHQFGQIIALVYLLNGNDFHLENVLAFGKYPVLIDLETIIQNHFPMPDSENAFMKAIEKNGESIVMSGLVPIYVFEERAEADVEGTSKGLQLSALSGGEQKLPYKILKLVDFDSVNMQFTYQEHITDAAENIPMFKGEKVDFVPYIQTIIEGFKEFSAFALVHKESLAKVAQECFSDCLVRNVIKTTQSYGDLLDYSTHPSCMVDYIEREKLFENLWMHGYSNSHPVPYEVRDMLQHDVPIFFNPTSTRELVASQHEVIDDMYQETAVSLEYTKIKNYSVKEEEEQLDYLKTSFGLYSPMDLQTQIIPPEESEEAVFLAGAIAIGDAILARAFIGKDSMAWQDIEESSPDNFIVGVMNENFYDGYTGMYLYFSELYFLTGLERFREPQQILEAMVFRLVDESSHSISSFYGSLAAVYPLLYNYLQTNESTLITAAKKSADYFIETYDSQQIQGYDWTGGTASIIKLYIQLYEITKIYDYLTFARQLVQDIDFEKIYQGGFAHGYAGILHAVNSVRQVVEDPEYDRIIHGCLLKERTVFDPVDKGWLDIRVTPPVVNDLWCYGATGIGLAYLELISSGFTEAQLEMEIHYAVQRLLDYRKEDDCLCHGTFGDINFLTTFYGSVYASETQKRQIERTIQTIKEQVKQGAYTFEGLPTLPKCGLFTGLAGIGHQLLRLHDVHRTADVLIFELPNGPRGEEHH